MKKILILNYGLHIAGVSKALVDIANALDKKGYDVTIKLVSDDWALKPLLNSAIKTELFLKEPYIFGIRLHGFKRYYYKWINNLQRKNPVRLYNKIVKEKYDVEIAFNRGVGVRIIASSTNNDSIKLVWVHSDYMLCDNAIAGFKDVEEAKKAYLKFNKIVCVSDQAKKSFINRFGISDNVITRYNPIDERKIKVQALSKIDEMLFDNNYPIIVSVGRLCNEKGYDYLLYVHKKLLDEGYYHNLIIVGDGPERGKLQCMVDKLNLCNTTKLIGYTTNPYKYINIADFTVCSSKYEGFHIASAESIILSKPVVSRVPVVRELFGTYDCGVIGETDEEFENGIKRMLNDKTFFCYCKQQTLCRSKQFNMSDTIKQIEQLLI